MAKYTIHQAKTHFSQLLRKVASGEEVVIMNRDQAVAKLVPVQEGKRRLGWLKGKIWIADDFDEIPEGFEEYMPK